MGGIGILPVDFLTSGVLVGKAAGKRPDTLSDATRTRASVAPLEPPIRPGYDAV